MLSVKLPYCKITVQVTETPFGVQEISCPEAYETPLPNRVICKVDVLDLLRDRLDNQCFDCRPLLYNMFAGNHGKYDCDAIFLSYYRKFQSFRKLVNDAYYYGDETQSVFDRVVLPIRDELNNYAKQAADLLQRAGGKYLIQTHDTLYYSFLDKGMVPNLVGGKLIC